MKFSKSSISWLITAAVVVVVTFGYLTYDKFHTVITADLVYIHANKERVNGATMLLKLAGVGFIALVIAVAVLGLFVIGLSALLKSYPFGRRSRRSRRVRNA